MDLAHGGHLTHGSPASFSGQLFRFCHYGVEKESGRIDYEALSRKAEECRPKMIVAGASAYPRIIDFERFARVAADVGAYLMVDMAHIAGLVAGGVHPSPLPHADVVTSTTHKTLRGPRGGLILANSDFGDRLNRSIFPGMQGGPLMHVIAAKAVAFLEARKNSFVRYQHAIVDNAKTLSQALKEKGVNLVSGGTDNHMMLVDLRNLDITGRDAEDRLGAAGITVNKNSIPFDPENPLITSGIRIGTAAVTSRAMGTEEMQMLAEWIVEVLRHPGDDALIQGVREQVKQLCDRFPIYTEIS
jgi:glycine hydroxymethyltransferase